ncbi:SDR family oxidoreductase [Sunxiuqinia elliptica]|uniref:NADP-dependent 3-hydroxy acid dehydrogenase YdfG n=1 Tax=Sunxiuqinia elliptica TaxID=655355 RepID=A0A4R6H4Q2_9BACT|nr:SDR family oxidoreductase [Sunxiuqinia elliptica]TDO03100.1 NADP-dependent 3-hydroxy acid dehydrogenase YdfG [Sunxiuqinia elliptica]TDO59299.1 NADP-dependent 3-hydroxy acid dehydrogenase YdfG [Sunxiuqinia elliptica]
MKQKIAFITGATAGIGLETAKILAENQFKLILTGRRKERLDQLKAELEKEGTQVITLCFDVRNKAEVEQALATLPEEWKKVDVLINNAGLAAGLDPVHQAAIDDWETMIDTNVKGLLYMSRIVSNWMIEQQSGHIINISSIAGIESYPNGSVYCATKHAVNAVSKAMRIELAPHNIKVGTISPGALETEFSLVRFKGDQQKADQVYEGFTPLNARDIAESIYFVLSRPAHVNIADILIMPTAQGSARDIFRK